MYFFPSKRNIEGKKVLFVFYRYYDVHHPIENIFIKKGRRGKNFPPLLKSMSIVRGFLNCSVMIFFQYFMTRVIRKWENLWPRLFFFPSRFSFYHIASNQGTYCLWSLSQHHKNNNWGFCKQCKSLQNPQF